MDFFISASSAAPIVNNPAAPVLNNSLTLNCTGVIDCFFDDNRIILMSLSFVVSIIALLFSIKSYNFQVDKYKKDQEDKKSDFNLSINNGYWHQSVILPLFVDQFVLSVTKWIDQIDGLGKLKDQSNDLPATINDIRDNFKKDITQLTSRTQLLCTVDELAKNQIREKLDEIEDCVTRYLSDVKESNNFGNSPHTKVFEKSNDIFITLISDHKKFKTT